MTALRTAPTVDLAALEAQLRGPGGWEVWFDAGPRGAYTTDGSDYRQVPIAVVVPRTVQAGAETVAVCREQGAPVLSRGGGTSLGGQCTNTAVVIDWTKYCTRLVSVDEQARAMTPPHGFCCRDRSGRGVRWWVARRLPWQPRRPRNAQSLMANPSNRMG